MTGSIPFIQSSGLNSNEKTYLRVDSIRRVMRKNLFNQPIPGTNNSPNNEVDYIGTNNRGWVIDGWVPTRSGLEFPEGYGKLASTELSVSGLAILETTGSKVWFYDEYMTILSKVVNGVTTITESGTWVEVSDINWERNSNFVDSGYEVGYIIPFSLTLVETK